MKNGQSRDMVLASYRDGTPRSLLEAEADYGYGAAKRESYDGLKANLRIDRRGMAVGITTTADVDERDAVYDVLRAIEGLVLGDKGSIRPSSRPMAKRLASICKHRCAGT